MHTIADLEWLTLTIGASRRMGVIEVLMSPERNAKLEETIARRVLSGELIDEGEVPLSLIPRQAAERTLARGADVETLRILAGTPFVLVLQDLAGNPATPADILVKLSRLSGGFIAHLATQNATFPVEELEVVGIMGSMMARWGAILHPWVPHWLIERAGSDPAWPIRQAAACRGVTVETLLVLAADADSAVRAAAVTNFRLPDDVLHRLATSDPNQGVRAAAADNPTISEVTLLALAGDQDFWVRAAVAKSRSLTPLVAGLLADDPQGLVQKNLAANPACPPEVLKRLARRERGWAVRYEVAANPACPPEVRHRLATKDRSRDVRNRAAA